MHFFTYFLFKGYNRFAFNPFTNLFRCFMNGNYFNYQHEFRCCYSNQKSCLNRNYFISLILSRLQFSMDLTKCFNCIFYIFQGMYGSRDQA